MDAKDKNFLRSVGDESPHSAQPCPDCPKSLGYSPEYYALNKHVGPLMWDFSSGNNERYKEITTFLCGQRPRSGLGHDSMDAYKATETLGILAGLPDDWATCKTCGGSGEGSPASPLNQRIKSYEHS